MSRQPPLRIAISILLCKLAFVPVFAHAALDRDPCHGMPVDGTVAAKTFLSFDQFDKELRVAITRQDTVALAFLVTFPLRVNDAGGTISIDNAAALKMHFQEVFTPAIRKAILNEKFHDLGCNVEGIGYGLGVIWVNASDRGYAIWSVNRDAVPPYPNTWTIPKINFVCQTLTHRVVVETLAGGTLRYRSWNKPRFVTGQPDLEITGGKGTVEGTNVCAVSVYTFGSGTAVYSVVGGLGCFGDSEPGPPKDATGRLEVTVAGKPQVDSWCY